jgi:hypothetical protein
MIRFTCPKCKEVNRRSEEEAGQVVACSSCKQKLRVPAMKKAESKPARSKPKEEPLDDLEVVSEPTRRRKTADKEESPDEGPDEERDQEDEGDEDRPKKKKEKVKEVLGPRKAKYEPSKGLLIIGLVCFAGTGIVGLVFIILGFMLEGGYLVAPFFMIPIGVAGFLWCMSLLTLKVILHEGGIAHMRHGKRRLISWNDIKNVWQQITEHYTNGVYTGTSYMYTLELEDGSRFVYTNAMLQHVEKLGNVILHHTSEAIFPLALRDYDKGEIVDFGPLGVSQEGLHYGKSLLDWDEITAVKIKAGYISVGKRGKWFNWCNIAAASIPNLLVFESLVNQIVGIEDS